MTASMGGGRSTLFRVRKKTLQFVEFYDGIYEFRLRRVAGFCMRSVIELRRSAGIRPHWEIELDADAVHDSSVSQP